MTFSPTPATAEPIQLCGEHAAEVLNMRYEVQWPDGSQVHLHPVRQHGSNAPMLRAVHAGGFWLLIDLKAVLPRDEFDIRTAQVRDQVGLTMYALRARFHNAAAFLAKIDRQHLAKWPGDDRPPAERPKATKPNLVFVAGSADFLSEPTGDRRFFAVRG
jgi:hypothetical protein